MYPHKLTVVRTVYMGHDLTQCKKKIYIYIQYLSFLCSADRISYPSTTLHNTLNINYVLDHDSEIWNPWQVSCNVGLICRVSDSLISCRRYNKRLQIRNKLYREYGIVTWIFAWFQLLMRSCEISFWLNCLPAPWYFSALW